MCENRSQGLTPGRPFSDGICWWDSSTRQPLLKKTKTLKLTWHHGRIGIRLDDKIKINGDLQFDCLGFSGQHSFAGLKRAFCSFLHGSNHRLGIFVTLWQRLAGILSANMRVRSPFQLCCFCTLILCSGWRLATFVPVTALRCCLQSDWTHAKVKDKKIGPVN